MSEQPLVSAFRSLCSAALGTGSSPELIYLWWRDMPGITDDQMIGVLKEFDVEPPETS